MTSTMTTRIQTLIEITTFTRSSLDIPILSYRWKNDSSQVKALILGGVHGDEIEGVVCAQSLISEFSKSFDYNLDLTIIPQFNIEGVLTKSRSNANGVDLNRNLPTKDWSPEIKSPRYHPGQRPNSEPENKALVQYLENVKPNFILSLHSWNPMINLNGEAHAEAEILAKHTGYKIEGDIGYPTPGCLGTYAATERNIPTITYEIQRGLPLNEVVRIHTPAILACLRETEKR
jgi:protein MpaA